jgi:hypothetical protein
MSGRFSSLSLRFTKKKKSLSGSQKSLIDNSDRIIISGNNLVAACKNRRFFASVWIAT